MGVKNKEARQAIVVRKRLPERDRLLIHAHRQASGCWQWDGSKTTNGYPQMGVWRGRWKSEMAHRLSYMMFKGHIPDGMLVCHSCDNPSCVNPGHLWVGSYSDNIRDAISKGRHVPGRGAPLVEYCKHGHLMSEYGIRRRSRGRRCLLCCRRSSREYMRRVRAEAKQRG